MTTYLGELRDNWRPLLAATFGLGTGYAALALYTPSIIAPHLIAEFGWSKAAFAALGSISLVVALCIPFAGRLADVIGVRLTVMIGMATLPASFVGYSLMTGAIWQYVAIYLFQSIFCITMTSTVYSRVAVQYVEKARGIALAIVAIGPTITGAVAGPVLNAFIEDNGWRATYHLLTVFSLVSSVITLLLLPSERRAGEAPPPRRKAREDYPQIFRSRLFWILVGSMFLCNLSQVLALSQLKLLLMDNGVAGANAGVLLSAFPLGILLGRFVSGGALDRWPAHWVGMLSMGIPSIGLVLLASSMDGFAVLMIAVVLVGFAFGAEGDIIAYIVAERFGVALYGSIMGLVSMAISISASTGALLLSFLLARTGTFDLFLLICAAGAVLGSLMLLLARPPHAA